MSEYTGGEPPYNKDPQAEIFYYAVGTGLFRVIEPADEGTAFKNLLRYLDAPDQVFDKTHETYFSRRAWLLSGQLEAEPLLVPGEDSRRARDTRLLTSVPTITYIGSFLVTNASEAPQFISRNNNQPQHEDLDQLQLFTETWSPHTGKIYVPNQALSATA